VSLRAQYFNNTVAGDLYGLMVGEFLGQGIGREVYANLLDPSTVIKFETGARSFQNVLEWETWGILQETADMACWLAPCVHISECGIVLIQKRCTPLRPGEGPKKVPAWITDIKSNNWGLYEGRPVAVDYGFTDAFGGVKPGLMRKVEWTE